MKNLTTITTEQSPYGYPIARFSWRVIIISGRPVHTENIYWDEEYGCYSTRGFYGKKDGTRGRQVATPAIGAGEVPQDIREALKPLISTRYPYLT